MYREILTKAIIAKGEKNITESKSVDVNVNVSKVLGCWIINHTHNIVRENQTIYIEGTYDAYLWYGFDNDTNCSLNHQQFTFKHEIPYTFTQEKTFLNDNNEIKEQVLKNPSCISMTYDNQTIYIDVEYKYQIDIIGETKLKIKVDDVVIDQMINTDYMNNKK